MSLLDPIVTIETKVNENFKIEGIYVEKLNRPNLILPEGLELIRENKKWFSVFATQVYRIEAIEPGEYEVIYQRVFGEDWAPNPDKYLIKVKEQ